VRSLRLPRRTPAAAKASPPSHHDLALERAPRPIWLPQLAEPVTLVLGTRETLPARIVEREADSLVAAVIVPAGTIRERDLSGLTLEYKNPGGRVRLAGSTTVETTTDGVVVRIRDPRLLEVVQERAHVRVNAECPIVLRRARDGEELRTTTVDVSGGGVLTASAGHYLLEDELSFELFLGPASDAGAAAGARPAGGAPVTGRAHVARIDPHSRMGLYFSDISPADRWRLIRYTVECQEQEEFRHPGAGRLDAGSRGASDR
jgi:hypothetical protein